MKKPAKGSIEKIGQREGTEKEEIVGEPGEEIPINASSYREEAAPPTLESTPSGETLGHPETVQAEAKAEGTAVRSPSEKNDPALQDPGAEIHTASEATEKNKEFHEEKKTGVLVGERRGEEEIGQKVEETRFQADVEKLQSTSVIMQAQEMIFEEENQDLRVDFARMEQEKRHWLQEKELLETKIKNLILEKELANTNADYQRLSREYDGLVKERKNLETEKGELIARITELGNKEHPKPEMA